VGLVSVLFVSFQDEKRRKQNGEAFKLSVHTVHKQTHRLPETEHSQEILKALTISLLV
jgi:hypothetical protein